MEAQTPEAPSLGAGHELLSSTDPGDTPNREPRFLGGIQAAATAVLGLAAFVYLTGGAVLWARLRAVGLPADTVVAVLPRELLVSTGLRTVVVPTVVLSGVALVSFFIWSLWAERPGWFFLAGLGLVIVVGGVGGGLIGFALASESKTWWFGWTVGVGLALLVGFLAGGPSSLQRPGMSLLVLVLAVGVISAVVRFIVELRVPRLDSAVVCVKADATAYTGLLIGETDDAVYLGQRTKKRVVAVPRDRIAVLWIGTNRVPCSDSAQ